MPKTSADDWWVLHAMILFDDIPLENRPTRVVLGSHHWAPINVPVIDQGDWEPTPLSHGAAARVPADLAAPYPGEVLMAASARSAVVRNPERDHEGWCNQESGGPRS